MVPLETQSEFASGNRGGPVPFSQSSCGTRSITLIELLVVLALVGILAALLLPVLSRAYRRATVLACPIAYVASNATVWICDPQGQRNLQISKIKAADTSLSWSPDWKYVAYSGTGGVTIVNPVTERTKVFRGISQPVWVDADTVQGMRHFLAGNHHEIWRIDIRTGRTNIWKRLRLLGHPYGHNFQQYSPYLTDGFVVCEGNVTWTPTCDVVMRDQDWNLKKVIWRDPDENHVDFDPRVDWVGEHVAWSRNRASGPTEEHYCVALKSLEDESEDPPQLLGSEFENVFLCDWTVHDELLVNIKTNGEYRLGVMNTEGKLLRMLPTREPLFGGGAAATWRRPCHF